MEAAVATLLLITASVVMACVVVDYAVTTIQQSINVQDSPELSKLQSIENNLMNGTSSIFNSTIPGIPNQPTT